MTMRSALLGAALAALALCASYPPSQLPLSHGVGPGNASAPPPAYRHELLDLHRSLVSISSISGNESAVGRFLARHLEDRGYTVERQRVAPRATGTERFNLIAWHGPSPRANASVVVTSHIDVVPPYIPYHIDVDAAGPVTERTVIRGRGSVDAKGSVAAMVIALEQLLAAAAVARDAVMLVFVVGEEVGGEGMRVFSDSVADAHAFDAVIFGEPTENKLACGHKGALFCEVTATGTPGHSGYPWLGKSANEIMVRAMARLIDADLGSSTLFGNTTVNIGRFNGGVAANVIAEHANVGLAVRVAVDDKDGGAKAVHDEMEAIVRGVDHEALVLDCPQAYGPVECNCRVPGFETIIVNYGTDIPNLKGNYTKYLYGPGSILVAHGARENLTVGDLETAVEGYKKLILHALEERKLRA